MLPTDACWPHLSADKAPHGVPFWSSSYLVHAPLSSQQPWHVVITPPPPTPSHHFPLSLPLQQQLQSLVKCAAKLRLPDALPLLVACLCHSHSNCLKYDQDLALLRSCLLPRIGTYGWLAPGFVSDAYAAALQQVAAAAASGSLSLAEYQWKRFGGEPFLVDLYLTYFFRGVPPPDELLGVPELVKTALRHMVGFASEGLLSLCCWSSWGQLVVWL